MFADTFHLRDFNVRNGESPGDKLVQVAYVASLDAANNVIQTYVAPGTNVLVIPVTVWNVDAAGQITSVPINPTQSAGQPGGYIILAPGYSVQGGVFD